jgi:hypothetical protein
MKKIKILWLIGFLALLLPASLYARPVDIVEAEKAARQWISLEQCRLQRQPNVAPSVFGSIAPLPFQHQQAGYLVKLEPRGFILMPALTELSPVAFFSYEGDYDRTKDHPFLQAVQERLLLARERLGYTSGTPLGADPETAAKPEAAQVKKNEAAWDRLLTVNSLSTPPLGSAEMVPLLTAQWDQWGPYNYYVPDPTNVPAGCAAVAMAQLMHYWKHPQTGSGQHCYASNYGQLCADFQNTTYDWANMLDSYSGPYTEAQRQAVARLIYHVGIAIDTRYAHPPVSSGAYINDNEALSVFFKYTGSINTVSRRSYDTSAEWFGLFQDQLDNRLPVLLMVNSITGGANHAVVVDGYRTDQVTNLLHVNLGWGGQSNGYYAVDQIYGEANPGADQAVINIFPDTFIPDTSLSGTVTGYDGLPIEYVEIQVWKDGSPGLFQKVSTTLTDAAGFYSFFLTPGRYKVYFSAELANFFLKTAGSSRSYQSEWFDNQASLNWDMMIDYVETITVSRGEKKSIHPVLEKSCMLGTLANPAWFAAIPYGNGDFSLQWGIDACGLRYRLQRARQSDFSDSASIYLGLPPPYFFEHRLPVGSYYYRVRKENECGASLWTNLTLEVPFYNPTIYLPLILAGSVEQDFGQ